MPLCDGLDDVEALRRITTAHLRQIAARRADHPYETADESEHQHADKEIGTNQVARYGFRRGCQ